MTLSFISSGAASEGSSPIHNLRASLTWDNGNRFHDSLRAMVRITPFAA